ncbi:hypothetical protein [Streptomyces sp. NEAU-YJ-81]|uniref:hypothetical protein n=1 Tax=unclassified Streptomyces TaxID=2593676 RepID=UPI001ABC2498|nr:hypothetical protein [Streptomyces sp. NEAU-YJ-81]MBO3674862.1 hypothetical protein [Streptomyces sp. NEAU-YJ-81]
MTTDRRAQRAARLDAARQAENPTPVDPNAWLAALSDAELRAWWAEHAPLAWEFYKTLPIRVRVRLSQLEDARS